MGKKRYRTLLASHLSAFPAIIIVQEYDYGRQIIIPIPVNGTILLRWLWLWVQGFFPCGKVSYPGLNLLREVRMLVDDLSIGLGQLWVRFQFGTVLARSVAWGVLGCKREVDR